MPSEPLTAMAAAGSFVDLEELYVRARCWQAKRLGMAAAIGDFNRGKQEGESRPSCSPWPCGLMNRPG